METIIGVSNLAKVFSKTIKQPGLNGAICSFIHPEKKLKL